MVALISVASNLTSVQLIHRLLCLVKQSPVISPGVPDVHFCFFYKFFRLFRFLFQDPLKPVYDLHKPASFTVTKEQAAAENRPPVSRLLHYKWLNGGRVSACITSSGWRGTPSSHSLTQKRHGHAGLPAERGEETDPRRRLMIIWSNNVSDDML